MNLDPARRGWPAEFWLFGFVTAVYTNDWRTPAALLLFIEYGFNFFLFHGAEPTTLDEATNLMYMGTVVNVAVHFCGILLGLAFVYLTDFPNVLDLRFFHSDVQRARQMGGYIDAPRSRKSRMADGLEGTPWRSKPYAWTFCGLVVAVPLIFASILLFSGLATDLGPRSLTQEESNGVGGACVGIGGVLLLVYLLGVACGWPSLRQPDAHYNAAGLTLKYAFLLALALSTAAIFDFALSLSLGARYAATIGAAFVVYAITAVAGRYDRYLGSARASRVYAIFVGIWVIHAILYAGSAFLTTVNDIFAWLAGWSLGLAAIFVVVGWYLRSKRDLAERAERAAAYMRTEASRAPEEDDESSESLIGRAEAGTVEVASFDAVDSGVRRRKVVVSAEPIVDTLKGIVRSDARTNKKSNAPLNFD